MTTAVSGADYATRHPLTWSKDVLEGLNVEIAEGGLRLPAHRGLHGVVSIDYNLLAQVGVSSGMPKYWKLDIFLENCLTAKSFKTLDKRYVDVAYSTQPIQLQLPTSNIDLPGGGTYTLSDMIFLVYITPFAIDLQRKERAFPTTSSENDTGYYIAILIAMAQQVANSLGPGNDPYPGQVLYPSDDGMELNILSALIPASFLENFIMGSAQADTLQVYRTVVPIGNGSMIAHFAKRAIASAPKSQQN